MDTAQRAMVASRLANMNHGGDRKSEDFNVEISTLVSQAEAANLLNVSRESVISARKVLDQGSEELIQKVDVGEIAEILSVSKRMVSNYLGDIDKQIREDRKETIRSMYLQCYTADDIADEVGLSHFPVVQEIQVLNEMEVSSKTYKTANFQDDLDIPIYNRFSYGKVIKATDHFGYSEARINFHYARYYFLLYKKI